MFIYFLVCFFTIKEIFLKKQRKEKPIIVVQEKKTRARNGVGRRKGKEGKDEKNSHKLLKESDHVWLLSLKSYFPSFP